MKSNKFLVVCILIFVLLTSLAACGSSSSDSSTEVSTVAEAAQPGTAETVIPTADAAATVDGLIASWQDINSADRFANITKVGDAYQYEDNDGKYTGTFSAGKLVVTVSETETADVFVDSKTGHMFLIYQGTPTEFKKK